MPKDLLTRQPKDLLEGKAVMPEVIPPSKSFGKRVLETGDRALQTGAPLYGVIRKPEMLPVAGQVAGGMVGGLPGASAGAGTGKVLENVVNMAKERRLFNPLEGVAPEMAGTATVEGIFRGVGRSLKPAANKMMFSILKPSRDVIKKNPNLGTEALEQGIYGSKEQMLSKSDTLIKKYESEIKKLIQGRPERINAEQIIQKLNQLKANAVKGLKPEDASAIEDIHSAFISQLPTKTITESRQFVRSVGKSTTPQVTKLKGGSVQNKIAEPKYSPDEGKYINEIVTPKKIVESPEDIVALHSTGLPRKLTSVTPKVTYSVSPGMSPEYSASKEVVDPFGMNLEQAQAMKKAIYSETPGSAFYRNMSELPGKGEARRTIASSLRRQIGGAAPEVKPILRKESVAIETKKALENALANEQKRVLLPKLAGMGAGGLILSGNPTAGIGVLAGDTAFDLMRSSPMVSNVARILLDLSKRRGLGVAGRVGTAQAGREILN